MKGFFERPCQPVNEVKYVGHLIRSWCPSQPNHSWKGGLCLPSYPKWLSAASVCPFVLWIPIGSIDLFASVNLCVRVRVCILHVSGCVFGVIALELQACQWPFLIYSSIKKLLPALAFLFYVCSSSHEQAPWLLSAMFFFFSFIFLHVDDNLCSVCACVGGAYVRCRSVVSVWAVRWLGFVPLFVFLQSLSAWDKIVRHADNYNQISVSRKKKNRCNFNS